MLLREHASTYPESAAYGVDLVGFRIIQLNIRCNSTSTAIFAVAEKFDKATGFKERRKTKVRISQGFSTATYRDFCEADELHNAYNYATNMGREVFFECTHDRLLVDAKTVPGFSDFVSAIYFHANGVKRTWDVYHTLSGLACSSSSRSRAAAVAKFRKRSSREINESVAKLPASKLDFLSRMREEYDNT